jgi:plastocyanin
MRRVVVLAVAAALAAPASALAAERPVSISSSTFLPSRALALVDDTVRWTNKDFVAHNVTFADGTASPDLARTHAYARQFTARGTFGYRCTLHTGMTGSVVVADLHLSGPATPVLYDRPAVFTGLAPGDARVELKRGTETVGTTTAGSDGRFSVRVPARVPGRYHATTGDGKTSADVALKVRPRVLLAARRSGRTAYVTVSTRPAQAGAPVVLQRRTASGWARVGSARLSSRSKATFRLVVRGTTRVRAKLTRGVRGYSPSTSSILTLR